jgi:hypothetical protein
MRDLSLEPTMIREQAEAWALAIECGLADSRGAVDWACELVAEQANPLAELIEIAGAIRPHPMDVVAMLRRVPGQFDPLRVFRKFLATSRDFLKERPSAWPRITRALEQMAIHTDVPEPLASPCRGFDDQRLLAEQGIDSSVEKEAQELVPVGAAAGRLLGDESARVGENADWVRLLNRSREKAAFAMGAEVSSSAAWRVGLALGPERK